MATSPPTRRLAAILAADVVGYSGLMGIDEVGTLAALKALRAEVVDPAISRHNGRLFKTTGDGFLTEFPSVVDAVSAAVEMQGEVAKRNAGMPEGRRLVLRVGVNLGDVIAEGGDVYGDGVNIAARIEGIAPAGGVAVSATVRDHVGTKLGLLFRDMGEQRLKNIAAAVRVYQVEGTLARSAAPTEPATLESGVRLAVLPFDNMTGDPEQEHFVDGIVEDLLAEMSRYRHLAVASRSSSSVYKKQAVNARLVGRELGVDFILEGSLRRSGDQMRVIVQLIDCETGAHVWAERYNHTYANSFDLQDEIVSQIHAGLTMHLDEAVAARGGDPNSIVGYRAYANAMTMFSTGDDAGARAILQTALKTTPDSALVLAALAFLHACAFLYFESELSDEELISTVRDLGDRAVRLDPVDPYVLNCAGYGYFVIGSVDQARRCIDLAASLSPRDIYIALHKGLLLGYAGRYREGIDLIERACASEPRLGAGFRAGLFEIHYLARDYQAAIDAIAPILKPSPQVMLERAAALAQLGRLDEALVACKEAIRRLPDNFSPSAYCERTASLCANESDAENWREGFRKLGIAV